MEVVLVLISGYTSENFKKKNKINVLLLTCDKFRQKKATELF